ncbi:MAG: carboxypeptidase-like regulatory domain-containing protein [Bacteroidota bacterium]
MQIHRIKLLLIFVLGITANYIHAQVAVNGTVTDSLGKPVQSVSITLKKSNGIVLAFAITNNAGTFKIQYNGAFVKDSLLVEANAISFKKQSLPVNSATQTTNFKLSESSTKLPNVTVKAAPLKKEGDTLNYDVASFSTKQDRTIGDVIKKLPGVEVGENGQISYGGKPINRFYIDGDNLLDGKYNIATRGIPNDVVSKVQVLENHQPIKALSDVKSESAAMNIVLKDKARLKIMGTGDAAVGTPSVYNVSANAMLFQKKVKFINYIKMNNMGSDISEETINHFGGEDAQPVNLVSVGAGNPNLSKKRYLFNNAGLVNANDLINLKNEYQLRINAFYLWDRQFQSSQFKSTYFLPNDTIRYSEKQDTRTISSAFNTQFTLTANKKNYYLNNVTVLENKPTDVLAALQATTSNNITQYLNGTVTNVSNRFGFVKKSTNGQILSFGSSFSVIHNPATFTVEPGLYPAQFNNNVPYAGLIQQAAVPTFVTDNNISFSKIWPTFQMHNRIGVNYQEQQLNSLLESKQMSGSKTTVADSFVNRLNWARTRAYAETEFTYNKGLVTITGTVPFTYQDTKYTGRLVSNHMTNPLFTPRVSFRLATGKEAYISLAYSYGDVYGGISQVYDSYVMKGYRSFFSNGTLLNESKTHTLNGAYSFKNTLKIFFVTVAGSYMKSESNTINDTRLSSILQQSTLIPFVNIFEASTVNINVSKYIFPLMTTISGRAGWQKALGNGLQNGDLLQTQSDSYTYVASLNSKLSSWFNMSYTGTYTTFGSKPIGNAHTNRPASPKVERWQHELSANFSISNDFYFRVGGDNYRYLIPGTQENNYTFVDAAFTCKLNKLKTDIELSLTNLANIDTYGTASLSSNSIVESSYRIRPRMAMVKFYFRF